MGILCLLYILPIPIFLAQDTLSELLWCSSNWSLLTPVSAQTNLPPEAAIWVMFLKCKSCHCLQYPKALNDSLHLTDKYFCIRCSRTPWPWLIPVIPLTSIWTPSLFNILKKSKTCSCLVPSLGCLQGAVQHSGHEHKLWNGLYLVWIPSSSTWQLCDLGLVV